MKKRILCAVLAACVIFLFLPIFTPAVTPGYSGVPVTVKAVAPDETLGAEKITVSLVLTVPRGTEVYCLDLSLYYELRFFTAGEHVLQLQSPYSSGSLEKNDNELRFLYDSQTPLTAGTYTLFTAEFAPREYFSEREAAFDVVVWEAYQPYINSEGELEYVDIPSITEPARVYLGERLKPTPNRLKTYVGGTAEFQLNKAYARYENKNPQVIAFDAQTNTVIGISPGTAELVFYTGNNESATLEVEIYAPDPRLKSITLSNGTLTREFDPDVYSYTVNIPWDQAGLMIDHTETMDGMSSVMVQSPAVQEGKSSTAVLTVTGENGLINIYMITVKRASRPTVPNPPDPPTVPTQITSSAYSISGSTLHKVKAGTTVNTLLNGIKEKAYVTVYRANGTTASGTDLVCTGYQLKLPGGQSWSVVVTGDANGDGKITAADYVNVKFVVLGKQSLTGVYWTAADVNGDGKVTAADYVNIKFHVLGKTQITPR